MGVREQGTLGRYTVIDIGPRRRRSVRDHGVTHETSKRRESLLPSWGRVSPESKWEDSLETTVEISNLRKGSRG